MSFISCGTLCLCKNIFLVLKRMYCIVFLLKVLLNDGFIILKKQEWRRLVLKMTVSIKKSWFKHKIFDSMLVRPLIINELLKNIFVIALIKKKDLKKADDLS